MTTISNFGLSSEWPGLHWHRPRTAKGKNSILNVTRRVACKSNDVWVEQLNHQSRRCFPVTESTVALLPEKRKRKKRGEQMVSTGKETKETTNEKQEAMRMSGSRGHKILNLQSFRNNGIQTSSSPYHKFTTNVKPKIPENTCAF